MQYQNPGEIFIKKYGFEKNIQKVEEYISFLCDESGLQDEPPINLGRIYSRFGFEPKRIPLPSQQGILMNPDKGLVYINDEDSITRQRFSEAHEIIEFFFASFPDQKSWAARRFKNFGDSVKENLCEQGAAILLMPEKSYRPRVLEQGVSISTAKNLAQEYEVSLTSSLLRMIKLGPGSHAIVLWKHMNSKTELKKMKLGNQLSLFSERLEPQAPRKLRVQWAWSNKREYWIPKYKSINEESSIFRAWNSGIENKVWEDINIVDLNGRCEIENLPFESADGMKVISLIHLPGDFGCSSKSSSP